MDIVITHVNFNDLTWQAEYKKYFSKFNYNRHRAEVNLKYLFRGIAENINFVDNIYLVVSSESQVYDWINKDKIKIILHKDIIPEEFLPTFNSCTIEMFLHKIPNLSEEFIYFNDDEFIINKKSIKDYIINNKSNMGFYEYYRKPHKSITEFQYVNDFNMALKLSKSKFDKDITWIHPCHIPILFFKKDCDFVYNNLKEEIHKRISKTRTKDNNSQYLFLDYLIFTNKWFANTNTYKYGYINIKTEKDFNNFKKYINSKTIKDLCVNYVAEKYINEVNRLFELKFPNKCTYEL